MSIFLSFQKSNFHNVATQDRGQKAQRGPSEGLRVPGDDRRDSLLITCQPNEQKSLSREELSSSSSLLHSVWGAAERALGGWALPPPARGPRTEGLGHSRPEIQISDCRPVLPYYRTEGRSSEQKGLEPEGHSSKSTHGQWRTQ